jgi:hypothetical protein
MKHSMEWGPQMARGIVVAFALLTGDWQSLLIIPPKTVLKLIFLSASLLHWLRACCSGGCFVMHLPFGTRLRVINPSNNKTVMVTVTDRGPFVPGRSLDLSYGAFAQIASPSQGVAKVCYSVA